jgi:hypothetical protein
MLIQRNNAEKGRNPLYYAALTSHSMRDEGAMKYLDFLVNQVARIVVSQVTELHATLRPERSN